MMRSRMPTASTTTRFGTMRSVDLRQRSSTRRLGVAIVDDGDYVATMPVEKTDAPIVDDAGWWSLAESVSAGCVGVGVLGVSEKMVCEASFKCSNAPMQRGGTIEDAAQQKKLVCIGSIVVFIYSRIHTVVSVRGNEF